MLDKLGFDGLKHIVVSAIIITILNIFLPMWLSATITLVIGVGKELYDKISGKGCAEWKDIVCDIIGIVIGVL